MKERFRASLPFAAILFLLPVLCPPVSGEESWQAVKRYSYIDPTTPQDLAGGEIRGNHVPMEGLALNMDVETCYVLALPPEKVIERIRDLKHSPNDTGDKTLGASIDHRVSSPATRSDLQDFSVQNIAQWSFFGGGGGLADTSQLNLDQEEKQKVAGASTEKNADKSAVSAAWKEILLQRALAFQNKGLMGSAPYQTGNDKFEPGPELVVMLKKRGPVLNRFLGVLDGVMSGRQVPNSLDPVYYWENSSIQGDQTVALAGIFVQTGESYKTAEITYYVSSKYYISLTLSEFFPVQINGKTRTFVWRSDFVITPSIGFAKGIERMAAENIMLIEVKRSIRSFMDECSKAAGS